MYILSEDEEDNLHRMMKSYLYKKHGSSYDWALDLYKRVGLPELEGREMMKYTLLMHCLLLIYWDEDEDNDEE